MYREIPLHYRQALALATELGMRPLVAHCHLGLANLHRRVGKPDHEKVMYLPIWQLAVLQAYGPRMAESGLGLIADYPWSAPYEDVKVKGK